MSDELSSHVPEVGPGSPADVGRTISEMANVREAVFRQGRVVAVQAGPPRTISVEISGNTYTAVRVADSVAPVVNEGVWVVDIGMGRWLAIATASTTLTTPGFLTAGSGGALSVSSLASTGDITSNTNILADGYVRSWDMTVDNFLSVTGSATINNLTTTGNLNAPVIISTTSVTSGTFLASTRFQAPNGTAGAPSFTFTGSATTGLYYSASGLEVSVGGTHMVRFDTSGNLLPATNGGGSLGLTGTRWSDGWFSGTVTAGTISGTLSGNGSSVTSINAANISSGTLPNGRLNGGDYTPNTLNLSSGTSTNPALRFTAGSNTGIYSSTTNRVDHVANGNYCFAALNSSLWSNTVTTTSTTTWRDAGLGQHGTTASNFNLKTEIEPLDGSFALSVIDQMQPVSFLWKPLPNDSPEVAALRAIDRHVGFIAEWMEQVEAPWLLVEHGPPDITGMNPEEADAAIQDLNQWGVRYWKEPHVIALLTAAVKSLKSRVEALESQ